MDHRELAYAAGRALASLGDERELPRNPLIREHAPGLPYDTLRAATLRALESLAPASPDGAQQKQRRFTTFSFDAICARNRTSSPSPDSDCRAANSIASGVKRCLRSRSQSNANCGGCGRSRFRWNSATPPKHISKRCVPRSISYGLARSPGSCDTRGRRTA